MGHSEVYLLTHTFFFFLGWMASKEKVSVQIVSFLLDLSEEEEDRPEINTFDSLWGETGTAVTLYLVMKILRILFYFILSSYSIKVKCIYS